MSSPANQKFQLLAQEARRAIDLAETYLYDGALVTAADRLEVAAKLIRDAAKLRDEALRGVSEVSSDAH